MPHTPPRQEQKAAALLQVLAQAGSAGLSVAQLLAQLPHIPRRTAQRWLAQLSDSGRITAAGEGRGRIYRLQPHSNYSHYHVAAPQPMAAQAPVLAVHEPSAYATTAQNSKRPLQPTPSDSPTSSPIALAPDAQEVRAYVSRPLSARQPVGYQRHLLDDYQPNHTFYLPATARRQLHAQGRTADAQAPAGTYSRAILNRLLIDLSWASSHMEGNTYSRLDTLHLIEEGTAAKGKAQIETQMILNHKAAIELLVDTTSDLQTAEPLWSRYLLMNVQAALAENLLPNPADEGRLRQHAVDIGQSSYRPLDNPLLLAELLDCLLDKANRIDDAFEQALFLMVHIPYLQPFADINKRTSRLAANAPLFRANLIPLTFVGVPPETYIQAMLGIYEMGRVDMLRDLFIWAYERSTQEYAAIQQTLAEPDPLRLTWRTLIKTTIRTVVQHPEADAIALIETALAQSPAPPAEQAELKALILDELRRLHEGVLARYQLRPSELQRWQQTRQ